MCTYGVPRAHKRGAMVGDTAECTGTDQTACQITSNGQLLLAAVEKKNRLGSINSVTEREIFIIKYDDELMTA